jgi:6-phosphogluconolactonase
MEDDTMSEIHVSNSATELSAAAADWICYYVSQQQTTNDRFSILLSGGNTPKQLYDLLAATPYRERIQWQKIEIFFGDERFVPFDDDRNNGRMAFDHLLSKVPIPGEQIHYIKTDIDELESARQYGKFLRRHFEKETFDLALLGMGEDAHTLSLFPGSDALKEDYHWVIPSTAPAEPKQRITLTHHCVKLSKRILFLVAGKSKAQALHHVLDYSRDTTQYPAQLFRDHPNVYWFVDKDAMNAVNVSRQ